MKKKPINKVVVQGYLKENNLELKTVKGGKVISGTVTIATDAHQSFRVQFYKQPTKKDGTEDKAYTALSTLLPNNTVSIKKLLEGSTGASFDLVKEQATKMYVFGSLDEYAYLNDVNAEVKMVTLKGASVGVCKPDNFTPKAEFELDAYIKNMREEVKVVDGEEEQTGRLVLTALAPIYPYVDAAMIEIEFKTDDKTFVDEDNKITVSNYINDHWAIGQTVNMRGNLVNLMVVKSASKPSTGFGMNSISNSSETEFVEERLILGGSAEGIDANEAGQEELGFTSAEVKVGLAKRQERIKSNTDKKKGVNADGMKPGFASNNGFKGSENAPAKDFGLGASFGSSMGGFNPGDF